MKKFLALLLALAMILSLAACGAKENPAPSAPVVSQEVEETSSIKRGDMPKVVRWGSASSGSAGYVIITAFSDMVSKYVTEFKSSSMSTSGGAENIRLMGSGDIDFGQTTSADLIKAMNGSAPYESPIPIYQVVGYRTNAYIIHTLKKNGITTLAQLDGKKVAVGPASGSGRTMVEPGFGNLGLKPEFVYGSWDECSEMLKAGQCQAVVFPIVGGTDPTSAVISLNATADISVIEVSKEEATKMCEGVVGVSAVKVPANYISLGNKEFYAVGYHNALGARPEVNEDAVYIILKTLLEKEDELHSISSDLKLFCKENAFAYMLPEVPVHPGAAKLYKELGIWDENYKIGE